MYGVLRYIYVIAALQDLRFIQPPTRFMACCGPLEIYKTYIIIDEIFHVLIQENPTEVAATYM